MIAYVDESLRLDGKGLYVLAAVLVPDACADDVRAALLSTLRRGQRRFHFRKQTPDDRLAMCVRLADPRLDAVAVVRRQVDRPRQERARRLCLTRLLRELCERGVHAIVLESRHAADSYDRRLLAQAERAGWTSGLRYDFGQPDSECLLWLPDVVAGAAARALGDDDATYLDVLRVRVTLVEVP